MIISPSIPWHSLPVQAKQTVQWYKDNYWEKKYPYDSPAYRISDDKKWYIVFNESTGKILKSVNYNKVCFDNILPKKQ